MFSINSRRISLYVVLGLFFSLLAWAALTRVDVAVNFDGSVRPVGNVVVVQNFISGVVEEIRVSEGDYVKAGEVLVRLDASDSKIELARLEHKIRLKETRLDRLGRQRMRESEFEFREEWDIKEYKHEDALLKSALSAFEDEMAVLKTELNAARQELAMIPKEISSAGSAVKLAEKKMALAERLFSLGYEGELALLNAEADYQAAVLAFDTLESEKGLLERNVELLAGRMSALEAAFEKEVVSEISEVIDQLRELKSELEIVTSDLSKHDVRSRTSGLVSRLAVENEGQYLTQPETLLEIIPEGVSLAFEGRVAVADIGKVYKGQPGKVVLSNMDIRTQPPIGVQVSAVGLDVQTDERSGMSYYPVTLEFEIRDNQAVVEIATGVEGRGFLLVGERSMLAYLMEPITERLFAVLMEQ